MADHIVFMLQLVITGVAVGGVYSLMALGFVLIFKASSVVNFGPGELVLFGAYVAWATILNMKLPLWIALPLTLAVAILLGLVIERGVLGPVPVSPVHLWSFVGVLILLTAFSLFFRFSLTGMAMRATADNQQVALSLGVSVKWIFALSWCIATVVSTLGGIILGS